MRFFKKNTTYKILLLSIFCFFSRGYTQPILSPGVLLKSETKQSGEYYFYTFQNQSVVLYEINTNSEHRKIWEYGFLEDKNTEPQTILYGDITGNGEKELIVVVYVFGQETQIYIFKTDDNIPTTSPGIYQLSSLRKGARPMQAELIKWDGDKDQEIILTFSSPERRIVLLDYNINQLTPISTTVADQFMSATYGPIKMEIFDYDQDTQDDLILYAISEAPERYIFFSKSKAEEITKIKQPTLVEFKIFKNQKAINELAITKKGELYSLKEKEFLIQEAIPAKNILNFSNNTLLILSNKELQIIKTNKENKQFQVEPPIEIPIQNQPINYLYNIEQNIMVFYDTKIKTPKLLLIDKELEWKNITEAKPAPLKSPQNTTLKKGLAPDRNRAQAAANNLDTLYINIDDTLEIAINQAITENIKSVETTKFPKGMFLDPETLIFLWSPTQKDIGQHLFQYHIVSETQPKLQIKDKDSSQVMLERVSQTQNTEHTHHLIVNDIPRLQIENKKDTINIKGSFYTNYTIQDQVKIKEYKVEVIKPSTNEILIDKESIYWEPKKHNTGNNEFLIKVSDGFAESTNLISVFVDTTINIKTYNMRATLNQEFRYQLPHKPNYKYNIINSPANLRISSLGEIHWIPLATQVDENTIDIDINTGAGNNRHTLNVYVNAPPVIAYRPAYNEYIVQGDTFMFIYQSFDLNTSPALDWSVVLPKQENLEKFNLTKTGEFQVFTDSLLDNQDYTIILSDGINQDKFFGTLYINSPPKIMSTPPDYLILGDTLSYQIKVQDINKEKPFSAQYLTSSANIINYQLLKSPLNTTIDSTGLLSWTPNANQLGSHNFDIKITDSLTTLSHAFTLFVNDKPNIISIDSLSIMVGDTLNHFFDASDLNGQSNLIYSIKTTIDELTFSGKVGKLTWVPAETDLGLHTLEISVSDGFSLSTDTQKLKIFVYLPPILSNVPDSTAYANLQYTFSPKAYDMYNDSVHNKDVFINFIPRDTSFTGKYNYETNILSWVPSLQDLGLQRLEFIIKDKYNITNRHFYDINVLMSPCETLDTLYINTTDTVYIENSKPSEQTITIKTKSPFSPFP